MTAVALRPTPIVLTLSTNRPMPGRRGSSVLYGNGLPAAAVGLNGDFYIDTGATPKMMYGPKALGSWPTSSWPVETDETPATESAAGLMQPAHVIALAAVPGQTDNKIAARAVDVRDQPGGITLGKFVTSAQLDANTIAANAAIARAIQIGARYVDFPSGDFVVRFSGLYNRTALLVQGATSLKLRGRGTRLWLAGERDQSAPGTGLPYCGAAAFLNCTGVCGFAGDWEIDTLNPAHAQGTITALTATYVEVKLDAPVAWTTACYLHLRTPEDDGFCALGFKSPDSNHVPLGTPAAPLTYRLDLTGAMDVLNLSLMYVGQRVVLAHVSYGVAVVMAGNCEKLIVPESLTIRGGAGMAYYGWSTPTDWRGVVEERVRDGIPDYMATTADGLHLEGCSPSTVRGRIHGTGDDCVNLKTTVFTIIARDSARQLRIASIQNAQLVGYMPKVGHLLDLTDAEKVRQARVRVAAITVGATETTITTASDLPTGITTEWRACNYTTSSNYVVGDGTEVGRCAGGGVRVSGGRIHIGNILIRQTLYDGVPGGSYFGLEQQPADILTTGKITAQRVGLSIDPVRPATGVVVLRPLKNDNVTLAGWNSLGRISIGGIDATDCGGMLVYIVGGSQVDIGDLRARNINLHAVSQDGMPAGVLAQFMNCAEVELCGAKTFGTDKLPLNLINVGRMKGRNVTAILRPTSGFQVLDWYGERVRWYANDLNSGYEIEPDGWGRQWGFVGNPASSNYADYAVTFPRPFVEAPISIVCTTKLPPNTDTALSSVGFDSLTLTGFTARVRHAIGGASGVSAVPIMYQAWGRLA